MIEASRRSTQWGINLKWALQILSLAPLKRTLPILRTIRFLWCFKRRDKKLWLTKSQLLPKLPISFMTLMTLNQTRRKVSPCTPLHFLFVRNRIPKLYLLSLKFLRRSLGLKIWLPKQRMKQHWLMLTWSNLKRLTLRKSQKRYLKIQISPTQFSTPKKYPTRNLKICSPHPKARTQLWMKMSSISNQALKK